MKPTVQSQVAFILSGSGWWSLWELQQELRKRGHKHILTAVSARVRDCRRKKYGAWIVKRRVRKGFKNLWEYMAVRGCK